MRRSRRIVGVVSDLLLWTVLIGIGVGVVFSLLLVVYFMAVLVADRSTSSYKPSRTEILIVLAYVAVFISTSVLGVYLLKWFGPLVVRRRRNRIKTMDLAEPADDPSAIEPRG